MKRIQVIHLFVFQFREYRQRSITFPLLYDKIKYIS